MPRRKPQNTQKKLRTSGNKSEQQERRRSKQQEVRRSKKQARRSEKQKTRTIRSSGKQMRRKNPSKNLISILLYTSILNSALAAGADSNTKIIIESDVFDENGVVITPEPGMKSIIERTLPPDAVAGQRIKMTYQGVDFYIIVPEHELGQVIQIKVPIRKCSQSETAEYLTSFVDPYGETPCDQRISDSTAFFTTRFGIAFGVMGLALALEAGGSSLAIEGVKEVVKGGQMIPTGAGQLANIGGQLGLTSGGVGTALSEPALSKAVSDVERQLKKMGGEGEFQVVENSEGVVVKTKGGVKPKEVPGKSLLRKKRVGAPKQTGNLPEIDIEELNKWDDYNQGEIKIYKERPTDRGYITKEGLKDIPKGPTAYSESASAAQRNAFDNEDLVELRAPEKVIDWKPGGGALEQPPGSTLNPNPPRVKFSGNDESVRIPFRSKNELKRATALDRLNRYRTSHESVWSSWGPEFLEDMKSKDYTQTQFDPVKSNTIYRTATFGSGNNPRYKQIEDEATGKFYFVAPEDLLVSRYPKM